MGKHVKPPLKADHFAIVNRTTVYHRTGIYDAETYKPHLFLIKESQNDKLGKRAKVQVKAWRDMPIRTLTLVERETCLAPDENGENGCEHWKSCFGNKMPFAHRFKANDALMPRLARDLDALDKMYPNGYVVRLHILGDFFSKEYVLFWREQLKNREALHIFGYTRHWYKDNTDPWSLEIGQALHTTRALYQDRFAMRFSGMKDDPMSTAVESERSENGKGKIPIVWCPQQTGKTATCASCGLCWAMQNKRVGFSTI